MRLAGTRLQHHPSRTGLTKPSKGGPVWTGEVRFNEQWLDQPLRWKRPRMIFVCAHGDLFHESVPDAWIDKVFAVMALAPQHTFQVLTKRAERMWRYVDDVRQSGRWLSWRHPIEGHAIFDPWKARWDFMFRNVWHGISAEDQPRLAQRAWWLAQTPAAFRFLSYEPALGPLTARHVTNRWGTTWDALTGRVLDAQSGPAEVGKLHWIIAGGESGPGARPMHPDWARSLRDQCQAAGVAFFMKQMSRKAPIPEDLMVREWPR